MELDTLDVQKRFLAIAVENMRSSGLTWEDTKGSEQMENDINWVVGYSMFI